MQSTRIVRILSACMALMRHLDRLPTFFSVHHPPKSSFLLRSEFVKEMWWLDMFLIIRVTLKLMLEICKEQRTGRLFNAEMQLFLNKIHYLHRFENTNPNSTMNIICHQIYDGKSFLLHSTINPLRKSTRIVIARSIIIYSYYSQPGDS